ncbi:MAG TPA: carboxypeptidase regulatory-like domain-containing protein [Pyrinomonadaceae bacterium]|nr:carboxypeptidase regulatory-like domain-containing protein [Pyrinomonadaceae bacterium]
MRQLSAGFFRTTFCGLLFVLFTAVTVNAQFRANVQGTVTDPSGAVVAGATVTLVNNETSKSQTAQTSDEGFYRFSGLAPGKYTLAAEHTGFKKQELKDINVTAEETQGYDLTLSAGEVGETVTVTSESVPLLETETANVRGVITAEEVRRLPQIGRNPYELARTAPGVLGDTARGGTGNQAQFVPGTEQLGGASNTGVFQTENQTQISANGQRVSSNNYLIDGVSVNSLGLGGAAVVTPNQESVKEVSVVTSTYSAEDGRNTGAQIKVVSQNGTNEFHGSAVINYGSPKLNAFNQYFGSATAPRLPTRVEQYERKFAGSLGGPVYLPRFGEGGPTHYSGKNRLFFFASYEGLRRSNTNFSDIFIETPEFRQYVSRVRPGGFAARLFNTPDIVPRVVATGLATSGPTGGSRPVNGQAGLSFDIGSINSPAGQNVNPTPGGFFDGIPDVTLARVAIPNSTRGNQYNTRFDFNRTDTDQYALSLYFTKLASFSGSASGRPFEDINFEPFNSAATFTNIHTFSPAVLNEARFNFTRFNANELDAIGAGNLSIPRLQVQGFGSAFSFGGAPSFGIDRGRPNNRTQNTYELRDVVTWVRGTQAWKFGGEARHEQDNNNLVSGARPEFTFKSLLDFANDSVFFQNIDIDPRTGGAANGQRYFRSNTYGAFVQNDWKYRPNLTLNLGLRYEYQSPLTEKEGRLTNYVFGAHGVVDGRVVAVDRLHKPDRNNFAPRVGFAYSPRWNTLGGLFNEDRAVIRGGFGITYDRIFTNLLSGARGNPPFFARVGLCCSGTNNAAEPGPILYSFAVGDSPFVYPTNAALLRGIDPLTGGLLDPNQQTLPGGFVRRDIPVEVNGAPENLPNSYVYNYSLELQYQLTRKTVTSVGYVGNLGRKLIRTIDLNRYTPGDTFDLNRDRVQTADAQGRPVAPRLTGNPNFDRIFFPLPDVNSSYNSMILRVTRQYARGLQGEAVYRWSKSIDTSSFGRGQQQDYPIDQSLMRGPSDFDVRHTFTATFLWDVPFFNRRTDLVGKVLGGFRLDGIVTLRSGFPWTPVVFAPDNADPNGDGILPDRPTQYFGGGIRNPSNQDFINGVFGTNGPATFGVFSDCNDFPRRCFNSIVRGAPGIGRNSFRGPGYRSLDLSVVKQTGLGFLGERSNLELRANFFNVLNLLNLPSFQPATNEVNITHPDFGRATSGLAGRVVELQARFSF